MRVVIQKQLMELLSTAYDGLDYSETISPQQARGIIADCAEAVSAIKKILMDNLTPERFLYYESVLFPLAHELADDNVSQSKKLVENLYCILANELEVVYEIAFFPYKASMWDSLESIYFAAKNDPRCNAVVVPIPYFDINSNGTLGEIHYEGGMFPDGIPITSYNDYSFEDINPDVAYIHNPFDMFNVITTVFPRFYSRNMKRHVGILVYVPYYVTGKESQKTICGMVANTGIDIVIAQSEEDAAQFLEAAPDKTVVALGSPKIDRLLNFEKNKPVMPEPWKEKLNGKKIFFINSGINIMLTHRDKLIEKINHVFSEIAAIDGAAILWRPHPLSKVAMETICPNLLESYTELLNHFEQEELGVFDDSPDITRAIALSDAYIGESSSSVAFMFAATGKPVYYLDYTAETNYTKAEFDEYMQFIYSGYVHIEGGKVWLASVNSNVFMCVDLFTGETEKIAEFPIEAKNWTFSAVEKIGDILYASPLTSDRFVFYNIKNEDFNIIDVPHEYLLGQRESNFGSTLCYNGKIYFFPIGSKAIAIWDIEAEEMKYDSGWFPLLKPYISEKKPFIFSTPVFRQDDTVWLACLQNSFVLEYNLDTGYASLHKIDTGRKKRGLGAIAFDGDYYWIIENRRYFAGGKNRSENIYRWDKQTGKTEAFRWFPRGFIDLEKSVYDTPSNFFDIYFDDGKLYALPYFTDFIVEIDPKTGDLKKHSTEFSDFRITNRYIKNISATIIRQVLCDGRLAAISLPDGVLTISDTKTGVTQAVPLRVPAHKYQSFQNSRVKAAHCFTEHPYYPVGTFVQDVKDNELPPKGIQQAEEHLKLLCNKDGTCGVHVHAFIMDALIP